VSDTRSPSTDSRTRSSAPRRTAWVGWVWFAAAMMLMLGFFQAIEGLAAIFNSDFYKVGPNGLVVHVNYTVWGWVHLLVGAAIFLAGIGVLSGNVLARTVGVVLAVISAVLNLAFTAAHPAWTLVVIVIDVLVIYALVVHGREMSDAL